MSERTVVIGDTAENVTLFEYLFATGAVLVPILSGQNSEIEVKVPQPAGWTERILTTAPHSYRILGRDRTGTDPEFVPNVLVNLYRVDGHCDPAQALAHAVVDSARLPNWQSTSERVEADVTRPVGECQGYYTHGLWQLYCHTRYAFYHHRGWWLSQLTITTTTNQRHYLLDDIASIAAGTQIVQQSQHRPVDIHAGQTGHDRHDPAR